MDGTFVPVRMATVQELAIILHVHPNTVRHWSNKGLLKSSRIGPRGDRRFSWEDLRSFLDNSSNGAGLGKPPRGKVLIVDDDYGIRRLLTDVAEKQDCEAVSVESGERALEELEKQHFDLIFLDLLLPGLDGVDVLRAIKAKGKNPVVAVITGYGDEPIALEAMSLGPLVLIRNPLHMADIIRVLDMARRAKGGGMSRSD